MGVKPAAFARGYRQAHEDLPETIDDYGSALVATFVRQRHRMEKRLSVVQRSAEVVNPPVKAGDAPERDRDPTVVHVSATELLLGGLEEDLRETMRPRILSAITSMGVMMVGDGWRGAPQVRHLAAQQEQRLTLVGQAAAARVDATLLEAHQAGSTFAELGDRLGSLWDGFTGWLTDRQAGDEATTTLNGTSSGAASWGALEGVIRVWRTEDDERVRPTHEDAEGQERALDEPFTVGGDELDYPGDPSGSPEEICNCRCRLEFLAADGTPLESDDELDQEALDMEAAAVSDVVASAATGNGIVMTSGKWWSDGTGLPGGS